MDLLLQSDMFESVNMFSTDVTAPTFCGKASSVSFWLNQMGGWVGVGR